MGSCLRHDNLFQISPFMFSFSSFLVYVLLQQSRNNNKKGKCQPCFMVKLLQVHFLVFVLCILRYILIYFDQTDILSFHSSYYIKYDIYLGLKMIEIYKLKVVTNDCNLVLSMLHESVLSHTCVSACFCKIRVEKT